MNSKLATSQPVGLDAVSSPTPITGQRRGVYRGASFCLCRPAADLADRWAAVSFGVATAPALLLVQIHPRGEQMTGADQALLFFIAIFLIYAIGTICSPHPPRDGGRNKANARWLRRCHKRDRSQQRAWILAKYGKDIGPDRRTYKDFLK